MDIISSTKNPKIKNVVKLQEKSQERRRQGMTVVEGRIELSLCKDYGKVEQLYICKSIASEDLVKLMTSDTDTEVYEISESVFAKIAYREKSTGMVAIVRPPSYSLDDLQQSSHPFLIILEGVEKPGNLGAILRTADAAGADGLIICDAKTDLYNPNTIRSSIGCAFTVPLIACDSETLRSWLVDKGIRIYGAALSASVPYTTVDFTQPSAILMGTEATGLSDYWLDNSDQNIIIPMHGKIDSMNVSVATAILAFEVVRQRTHTHIV